MQQELLRMNEIASGPVSAIPLKSTHVNRETSIETVQASVKRVREEVTVIDTYDWRGVKSSVSREYTVDRLV